MVECPQCGASNEENVKNCRECRVNLYWAFQHYEELARIRQSGELAPSAQTPGFLVETSKKVDEGPTVGWLRNTIMKLGLKAAGKKVSTMAE